MPGDAAATVLVGVVAFTPLALAADVIQALDAPSGSAIIGALAGGGFSLWYGWYVTTTTLPKIIKEFRDELAAERAGRSEDARLLASRIDALSLRERQ